MNPFKTEYEVLIVGAGPTGLTLAAELAVAGVDVAILERRETQQIAGARAGGLHPRTLELFDQRGIADRFVAQGTKYPVALFPGITLSIGDLPTRHNYWLGLWQENTESILADRASELGVHIHRGVEVASFSQDDAGVQVQLADGRALSAAYLVGSDGGRSLVRKGTGIAFPGWEPSISYLMAECEMTAEPAWGIRYGAKGTHALGKLDDGKRVRAVLVEDELRHGETPTAEDLRAALIAVYGTDFGLHHVAWISRFTDAARQAASYRDRRVLLAGDSAHVHSPVGGQGLNLGVQDAMNLGWKLAQVVRGISPAALLDTYQAERHPVTARVLKSTLAITALTRGDDRTSALRDTLAEVMAIDAPRLWYVTMLTGLDIRLDLGQGHPLLGRRMPDLDLLTPSGTRRVFELLHEAKPLLLNFSEPGSVDAAPWASRVRVIDAQFAGAWTLPAIGPVTPPTAVLVRPDGHVAWTDHSSRTLAESSKTWFGSPG